MTHFSTFVPRAALILLIAHLTAACDGFKTFQTVSASKGLTPLEQDQLNGKALYDSKCAGCHGPVETSAKHGASVAQITNALATQSAMRTLQSSLTSEQVRQIALALNGDLPVITCEAAPDVGKVAAHRLNRTEFDNSLRDLLGVMNRFGEESGLPSDEFGGNFNNNAVVLGLTPTHISKYLEAAEKAVDAAFANTTLRSRLVSCTVSDAACVTQVLTRFLLRAFRRPATAAELTHYTSLVQFASTQGDSPEVGLKAAMTAALVSSNFLFRAPKLASPNDPAATVSLDPYDLATRMSYFIWSSTPDDELLEAARTNQLSTPAQLAAQVRRLLQDPKSAALLDNFATQWMQLQHIDQVQPDASLFPTFNASLRADLKTETRMLIQDMFKRDGSFYELLNSEATYVNDRLAQHYGIANVSGSNFRKVSTAGSERVGVITQGSLLAVNANPDRTSIVKRGKWVLENLLCTPPPPPPADVTPLNPANGDRLTLRERLEQHRANPTCFSCHAQMDPIGFALEGFDPLGRVRTSDGGLAIDNSGEFPDGRRFTGAREMAKVISDDRKFKLCVSEKLFTYALGRLPETYDRCSINRIGLNRVALDQPVSALVIDLVTSDPFRKQRGDKP